MYSTLRTSIFLISTIITFILFPFLYQLTYLLVSAVFGGFLDESLLTMINSAIFLLMVFLIFAGLQAILRQVFVFRRGKGNSVMSFPIKNFAVADQVIYYIVPFLVYLFPLFRISVEREVVLIRIASFAITLLVFYGVLQFSKKNVRGFFMQEGLLIKGVDLRLDFPIPAPFINSSGYYPYHKLEHYLLTDSTVEFQLPAESGKITLEFDPDEKENLKQFLMMMNIPQGISHRDE